MPIFHSKLAFTDNISMKFWLKQDVEPNCLEGLVIGKILGNIAGNKGTPAVRLSQWKYKKNNVTFIDE